MGWPRPPSMGVAGFQLDAIVLKPPCVLATPSSGISSSSIRPAPRAWCFGARQLTGTGAGVRRYSCPGPAPIQPLQPPLVP